MYKYLSVVYCIPLYGGLEKKHIQEIQVLQNKVARLVCHAPPRSKRTELYQRLGWLTFNQLIHYHTLISVFRLRAIREQDVICLKYFARLAELAESWFLCSSLRQHQEVLVSEALHTVICYQEIFAMSQALAYSNKKLENGLLKGLPAFQNDGDYELYLIHPTLFTFIKSCKKF